MFPGRKITAVFQQHLYTRTRDFHRGFAQALSLADEVLLVPIYPAREEPIEGVSSDMIAELLTVPHRTVPLEHIAFETEKARPDILITFGAGNIENYTGEIARRLRERPKKGNKRYASHTRGSCRRESRRSMASAPLHRVPSIPVHLRLDFLS